MPGHSDPNPGRTAGQVDHLAHLAADSSLSRRQILTRAVGLAAAAMLPSWVPAAQSRAANFLNAHISISSPGKCPPPKQQACGQGMTLGEWTLACTSPAPNGTRAAFNGCGPEKWNHLSTPLKTLAKTADHPTLLTSFTSACNAHDCCYGTCGSSKETCDKQIRSDLVKACIKSKGALLTLFGGPVLYLSYEAYCNTVANTYYEAIANTKQGRDAFTAAQEKVCGCCEEEKQSKPGGRCEDNADCAAGQECCGEMCFDPAVAQCCNPKWSTVCKVIPGWRFICPTFSPAEPPSTKFGGQCEWVPEPDEWTCASYERDFKTRLYECGEQH
ncbi:MAG TPA: hypothetical protein VGN84_05775 [Solirubrobacterales bacterium]|jgi:hypothetical protein|nr:hypothetical protein [Solirubrobacterales bacterium]